MELPLVDVGPLVDGTGVERVARAIDDACRSQGFFVVVGHGIDPALRRALLDESRAFFDRPIEEKAAVSMHHGGRAWRGWFPEGGELTSGVPDAKEGYYFGTDLDADHPAVRAGRPLHGRNLYLDDSLRAAVDAWMGAVTDLGQRLLEAMAIGLGLDADWFRAELTADPTVLFRIFRYPPVGTVGGANWGVAEHTDYGLLTLLAQDDAGGLQVRIDDHWIDATPVEDSFVCNLGDMLERMTAGTYRSTPHRVVMPATQVRYSFPLFLDPGWDAVVQPVPGLGDGRGGWSAEQRWDGRTVFEAGGRYGDHLLEKVTAVFPELAAAAFGDPTTA